MANTFSKIASSTVGIAGTSSIDFTSIPSTYTDLYITVSVRTNLSYLTIKYDDMGIKINTSSANGTNIGLDVNTDISASPRNLVGSYSCYFSCPSILNTTNTFGNASIYIPNYTGSNYKSTSVDYAAEDNSSSTHLGIGSALWSQTAAITSLSVYSLNAATLVQYSTATLYGIKNS